MGAGCWVLGWVAVVTRYHMVLWPHNHQKWKQALHASLISPPLLLYVQQCTDYYPPESIAYAAKLSRMPHVPWYYEVRTSYLFVVVVLQQQRSYLPTDIATTTTTTAVCYCTRTTYY